MTMLVLSQIIFNLVISFSVIVVSVLLSIIFFDTIKFIKATKKFLENVNKESGELYGKINNFFEGIFNLSFISNFFKKKKTKEQRSRKINIKI